MAGSATKQKPRAGDLAATVAEPVLDVLEARWLGSLAALTPAERFRLAGWFPHLPVLFDDLEIMPARKAIAISSPFDH